MASPPSVYFWCEDCGGSAKKSDGTPCPRCEGTGKVAVWTTGRRRFLRHLTNLPITVSLPERDIEGYCNQIAEGGLAAFLRDPIPVGSLVSLQFAVPTHPTELHLQGVVRYGFGYQHGLEFVSLKERERLAIRQFCTELPSVSPGA